MARVRGIVAMCSCLAGIGICQGVLVPAQGEMKRNWLPGLSLSPLPLR